MAEHNSIPPPKPLHLTSDNLAEKWNLFRLTWTNYEIANRMNEEDSKTKVATMLAVIREEGVRVFNTFQWADREDSSKINKVFEKFQDYCLPRKNIRFEKYKFNHRSRV